MTVKRKSVLSSEDKELLQIDELLGWDRLVYGYSRYGEPAVTRGAILSKIASNILLCERGTVV